MDDGGNWPLACARDEQAQSTAPDARTDTDLNDMAMVALVLALSLEG
ncbi:hypothetical protein OH708_03195 [Pseudomonas capsici]|nr:hypothetical protein [Pseudomonas capsici]MCV4264048.1 hypothetical protein [Pseudomonas capsici]MCV4286907.1 hypothetical protein [Pseudomonas capsici]